MSSPTVRLSVRVRRLNNGNGHFYCWRTFSTRSSQAIVSHIHPPLAPARKDNVGNGLCTSWTKWSPGYWSAILLHTMLPSCQENNSFVFRNFSWIASHFNITFSCVTLFVVAFWSVEQSAGSHCRQWWEPVNRSTSGKRRGTSLITYHNCIS